MRADSGFYTHSIVAVCRKMEICFSITIRQHARLWNLVETTPEEDCTPIPYWMDGAAAVAETEYTPFQSEPSPATVRLIVRRVKPTPGSQLALFANYSYHAFITDREGDVLELEADHRRHAEVESAIRDLKYGVGLNHLPSGRFAANPELVEGCLAGGPSRGPQPGPLDHTHRTRRRGGNNQDPQSTLLLPGRTHHPQGPSHHPASAPRLALGKPVQRGPGQAAHPATTFLTAPLASDPSPRPPSCLATHSRLG